MGRDDFLPPQLQNLIESVLFIFVAFRSVFGAFSFVCCAAHFGVQEERRSESERRRQRQREGELRHLSRQ